MDKLNAIIVEDEPLAVELLEGYIADAPSLRLLGKFHDPVEALAFMKTQKTDVVFLDIHLPKIKGFDFIKLMPYKSQIIITTAYNEYGVKSYEYEIVDYLLKPIEAERFLKAINKLSLLDGKHGNLKPESGGYSFFNVNKKKVKVYFQDIVFIESIKGYVRIYMDDGSDVLTKINISKMEKILPPNHVRLHKSFIVHMDKIVSYSATKIETDMRSLPIGRVYQKKVMAKLEGHL